MGKWTRKRLLFFIVTFVALAFATGIGSALASQRHGGQTPAQGTQLIIPGKVLSQQESTHTSSNENKNTQHSSNTTPEDLCWVCLGGLVADNSFDLLPDGQSQAVTISFDAKTKFDQESGSQQSTLATGEHVSVEAIKQADGTYLASEIKIGQKSHSSDDSSGNKGTDNSHKNQGSNNGSKNQNQGSNSGSNNQSSGSNNKSNHTGSDDSGNDN